MIDKGRKSHAWHLNYDGVAMNNDVTSILQAIEQGDPLAAEQLLPLVYNELRELATRKLAQEKPGQTLQATALVHDAYIRLVDTGKVEHWNSRGHFFAAAAEAMRRIVLDRARDKRRKKRGGGGQRGGDRSRRDPRPGSERRSSRTKRGSGPARTRRSSLREPCQAAFLRWPWARRSRRGPWASPPHGRPALGVRPRLALRPAEARSVTLRRSSRRFFQNLAQFAPRRSTLRVGTNQEYLMATISPELKAIFCEALECPSDLERRAYLDRACSGGRTSIADRSPIGRAPGPRGVS